MHKKYAYTGSLSSDRKNTILPTAPNRAVGVASIASVRTLAFRHRFRCLGYRGHPHPIVEDKRFEDEVLWKELGWGLIKIFTNNTYVIHVYYDSIAIVMQS